MPEKVALFFGQSLWIGGKKGVALLNRKWKKCAAARGLLACALKIFWLISRCMHHMHDRSFWEAVRPVSLSHRLKGLAVGGS